MKTILCGIIILTGTLANALRAGKHLRAMEHGMGMERSPLIDKGQGLLSRIESFTVKFKDDDFAGFNDGSFNIYDIIEKQLDADCSRIEGEIDRANGSEAKKYLVAQYIMEDFTNLGRQSCEFIPRCDFIRIAKLPEENGYPSDSNMEEDPGDSNMEETNNQINRDCRLVRKVSSCIWTALQRYDRKLGDLFKSIALLYSKKEFVGCLGFSSSLSLTSSVALLVLMTLPSMVFLY